MELFNAVCGICSIVGLLVSIAGLLVSIFTASKVIKIVKTFNCGNKCDNSRVVNKGKRNNYYASYAGRDNIHGARNNKQE